MKKQLSAVAMQALKEALCNIYWFKSDLRSFLQNCINDRSIIVNVNWDNYKRQIVSDVVDNYVWIKTNTWGIFGDFYMRFAR